MYIGQGTVNVSASIDVHEDTDISCRVNPGSGDVELTFGCDPYAQVFLTERGLRKLVGTLHALETAGE